MPRTKIDLEQLDEFKDVLAAIDEDQFVKWNVTTKKFEPAGPTIPGIWDVVDSGTTAVGFATETVLASHDPSDGEVLFPLITARNPVVSPVELSAPADITNAVPGQAPPGGIVFDIRLAMNGDDYEIVVEHRIKDDAVPGNNLTVTFDWVLLKVTV